MKKKLKAFYDKIFNCLWKNWKNLNNKLIFITATQFQCSTVKQNVLISAFWGKKLIKFKQKINKVSKRKKNPLKQKFLNINFRTIMNNFNVNLILIQKKVKMNLLMMTIIKLKLNLMRIILNLKSNHLKMSQTFMKTLKMNANKKIIKIFILAQRKSKLKKESLKFKKVILKNQEKNKKKMWREKMKTY